MCRPWVIVVVVGALGCRDSEPTKQPEPGSTTTPTPPAKRPADPSRPALPPASPPPPGIDPVGLAIDDAFTSEARDPTWAAPIEREVLKRVPDASDVVCRHLQCRLTVVVDTANDLTAKASELQSTSSLGGIAQAVTLTVPDPRPDGRLAVRVYVRFERSDAPNR